MAASKTSNAKKRRCTYAERTVTAISDIRKHHPRSPIHVKTLRAQIRRNAEARNDALGPRWQTGINSACKALSNQGVLDPEHPPGKIVLTPKGKQLIAGIRHSMGLPDDIEHDKGCDEHLGRKIMRRLSDAPDRTRRGASVISSGGGRGFRNAPSEMTKAELLKENKKLKEDYEALKNESSRKVAKLNAELEHRDDGLLEYQDLVSRRNEFSSDIREVSLGHDQSPGHGGVASARPEESETISPSRDGGATSANIGTQLRDTRSSDRGLLVRTNTGSFISSISKQPTPAPSDAGTESVPSSPVPGLMEVDERCDGDRVMGFDYVTSTPFRAVRPGLQTHTPTSSPPRVLRRHEGDASAMTEHVYSLSHNTLEELEKKLKDKDAVLKAQDRKILNLEGQLSYRSKLEEELCALRDELGSTEETQKALQDDKVKLQRDNERLKAELLEKAADLESVRNLLQQKDCEAEAKALEAHQALQNAKQTLRAELEKAQADSERVKGTLQETIKNLEESLSEGRKKEEDLSRKAQEKQDQCERLQVELLASKEQLNEVRLELEKVRAKLDKEAIERTRLGTDLAAAQEQNTLLESTVTSLRNELQDAQKELQTERESANKLHQTLREAVGQQDELLIELETKQTALSGAQSALACKESELTVLHGQLTRSDSLTKDLQASLATLERKARTLDAQNTLLAEALKDTEEEVADLKQGYEKLKRVQLTEFKEMDERVTKKRKRSSMLPALASSAEDIDIGTHGETVTIA